MHQHPCKICRGRSRTKCIFCGHKKPGTAGRIRTLEERKEKEKAEAKQHSINVREEFLHDLWIKLRKFQQDTTGDPAVDKEIRSMWGDWQIKDDVRRHLDCEYCEKSKFKLAEVMEIEYGTAS